MSYFIGYTQLILQLVPSDYNGFNISCFGTSDGSIDLTVTGGTPPYAFEWSNGLNTEDISNLRQGYYNVLVTDSLGAEKEGQITLTEPPSLRITSLVPYVYPNGFNISQYGACTGSVTASVEGGVTPYSYSWEPGMQSGNSPTNLCAGTDENRAIVTDANNCQIADGIGLSQPDRDDWTMSGNTGSNPQTQFLGTIDNIGLSFRTYNQSRLSISETGAIKFSGLAGDGDASMLIITNDGTIKNSKYSSPCAGPMGATWAGDNLNSIIYTCNPNKVAIGDGFVAWISTSAC